MTEPVTPRQLPTPALLRCIAQGMDGNSLGEITRVLATAFGAVDYLDCIRDLAGRGVDPQSYIDGLGQVSPFSIFA